MDGWAPFRGTAGRFDVSDTVGGLGFLSRRTRSARRHRTAYGLSVYPRTRNRLLCLSLSRLVLTFRLRPRPRVSLVEPRPLLEPLQVLRVLPLPPPVAESERTGGLMAAEQHVNPQPDVIPQKSQHPAQPLIRNLLGQAF